MFAQQSALQASWLGAFDRMQDAATSRIGVMDTATAMTSVMIICFSINCSVAQTKPRVELPST